MENSSIANQQDMDGNSRPISDFIVMVLVVSHIHP